MADSDQAPEDIGAPIAFQVLKDGTAVYDRAGDKVGDVVHVLADDADDIFHGLIVKTGAGHRYASADLVDGLFQHGVIVAEPAAKLPEPAENADEPFLKRAWDWLIEPK